MDGFMIPMAGGFVAVLVSLVAKAAWNGLRRNGKESWHNHLKAHNDSASSHPDMRGQLGRIEESLEGVRKSALRIEHKLDGVLPDDDID